jgi:hypothetical protein
VLVCGSITVATEVLFGPSKFIDFPSQQDCAVFNGLNPPDFDREALLIVMYRIKSVKIEDERNKSHIVRI